MSTSKEQFWFDVVFGLDPESVDFPGNAGIILPSGTTAQRPATPQEGHVRLNTDTLQVEAFIGGTWNVISKGTLISLDDTPASYAGQANRILRVNSAEDGTGFATVRILNSGAIDVAGVTNYETLVTTDDIITNKKYVDDADLLKLSLTGGTMTGNITFASGTITGLPLVPTLDSEAVSKSYVDGISAGLDAKESVRLTTTGSNITLSGNQMIDGVMTLTGDRILVKNQTNSAENGIYIADVGAWTRSPDMDGTPSHEVSGGNFTFVEDGNALSGTGWVIVFDGTINVGVNPIIWTQFSDSGGSFLSTTGGTMFGTIEQNSGSGGQFLGDPTLTQAAPSFSFTGNTDTGIISPAANRIQIVNAGTATWEWDASGNFIPTTNVTYNLGGIGNKPLIVYGGTFRSNLGAVGTPSYSFEGDTNTGMFSSGADNLDLSVGGVIGANLDSSGFTITNTLVASGLTYPTSDGISGQVITTDGLGNLTFQTSAGGVSTTIQPNTYDAITNWTARPAAEANQWKDIIWAPELSLFVAVAGDGTNRVMTSPDGITWTARSAAEANQWVSIAWAPELGLFAAVAINGTNRVMTSSNGITWTAQVAATAQAWWDITWSPELGLFAAVALSTDEIMTSSDGINWVTQTAPESSFWSGIAWSPKLGLFAAVSQSGTDRVMTSPDGITWTGRTAAEANSWQRITWSPELSIFVAVASDGTNRVMTSPDGITWTAQAAAEANSWTDITWSPELGLLIAIAVDGTNRIMTSPNGTTWTTRLAAENNGWFGVTWSPELGRLVAVASDGTNRVMISQEYNAYPQYRMITDDKANMPAAETIADVSVETWIARTAAEANDWEGIAWSPELGLFAAVARSGTNRVMTSPDGITWTGRTASEATNWREITWSPELGIFAAVSSHGTNQIMTSPDGITWTGRSAPESNFWFDIAWSPELGLFAAVAISGTNRVMTSPDGVNWTARAASEPNSWHGITWSPELGIFAAVSRDGTNRVMTSPDGITWTAQSASIADDWDAIAWSPELGIFAAVAINGSANRVMTSPDGINWITRIASTASAWTDIAWSSELGLFTAVASSAVMTSRDGIVWSGFATPTGSWDSIIWSPELGIFTAVALGGQVITSTLYDEHRQYLSIYDRGFSQIVEGEINFSGTIKINDLTYPLVDGTSDQVLTTDGAGNLTFEDVGVARSLSSNYYDAIANWTARPNAESNAWKGLDWSPELGIFVAVADTGTNRVMTSPDGLVWTARSAAEANNWLDVVWSAELGLFSAISHTGTNRVMTSPDGINWTARAAAALNDWRAITWSPELGLFAAVSSTGSSNRVMTSPDGITWTSRTSAENNTWQGIAWSPELGLFAAIASNGTNLIMTSPDGITWTSRSAPQANQYIDITWSSELGLFAAVSLNGTNRVMTSNDGINWINSTIVPTNSWISITWSPELKLFAAVATDSTSIIVSPNGVTWEALPVLTASTWNEITWSSELGIFVAVASSSTNRVMVSQSYDGYPQYRKIVDDRANLPAAETIADVSVETWDARVAAEANQWQSIIWAPEIGLFAAVSNTGTNRVMTSPNGITWTPRLAAETNNWSDITWSPELGLFAAVASDGTNRVMTSPDGITWTARLAAEANFWRGITWSPQLGLFAAVANGGTNRVMTSPDGITWTARLAAEANVWFDITWSPELKIFVAVSDIGTNQVMTSPDGITWTARTAAEANDWRSITWSAELGIFAAVSNDGTNQVMTSLDGITWTARLATEANLWWGITWSPELGIFAAVSTNGTNRVMTSTFYDEHQQYLSIYDRGFQQLVEPNINFTGTITKSSGNFSTFGDAQTATYIVRGITTDATPRNINPDGTTTNSLILPISTAWEFEIKLVARENATGDTKMVTLAGCIKRDGTTNTTLVGTVDTVRTKEDAGASAWTIAATADDTNEALQIQVTGEAAHTIRWVATVHITQVSG